MHQLFLLKMSISNIKRNSKSYVLYIIANIFSVFAFFIFHAIVSNPGINTIATSAIVKTIFELGMYILIVFSLGFMLYANSFIIHDRKKEFGVYNILGLNKWNISTIIFYENIIIGIFSTIIGIIGGLLCSKFFFVVLMNLLQIKSGSLIITFSSIAMTIYVFSFIFFMVTINNIYKINTTTTIQLLKGNSQGEKLPKNNTIFTYFTIITFVLGYYCLLSGDKEIYIFGMLTIILSTYLIFIGAIFYILNLLKNNQKLFYKFDYFLSVSNLLFRMKQNAIGLGNICILSTLILAVTFYTTALYSSIESRVRYVTHYDYTETIINPNKIEEAKSIIQKLSNTYDIEIEQLAFVQNKQDLRANLKTHKFETDIMPGINNAGHDLSIHYIHISDYNKVMNSNISLTKDEVLLLLNDAKYYNGDFLMQNNMITNSKDLYHHLMNLNFLDTKFIVKETISNTFFTASEYGPFSNVAYVVFHNNVQLEEINQNIAHYQGAVAPSIFPTTSLFLDINGIKENRILFAQDLQNELGENGISPRLSKDDLSIEYLKDGTFYSNIDLLRQSYLSLYGGIIFIGTFLSILFLLSVIFIMYFKQVSEANADKVRYTILNKIGIDKNDVKSVINRQIYIIFFLPLVVAFIHFNMIFIFIKNSLIGFGNLNLIILFAIALFLSFSILYVFIYKLTSKTYYRIVAQ